MKNYNRIEWKRDSKRYLFCDDNDEFLHRIDGPAEIFYDDRQEAANWYYMGKKINCKNAEEFARALKLLPLW